MKRLFFPILITLLAVFLWSPATAETIFSDLDTMTVLDAYGLPGDTVEVTINMANPSFAIEGIQHRIVYDETLLDIDTVFCVDRGCNLEAFTFNISTPGVIRVMAVTWSSNLIPRDTGPVFKIVFVVKVTATPGDVTSIAFQDEVLYDNAWSDEFGANLIIPQLIPGNFSIIGGGYNMPPVIGFIGSQSVAEGQLLQFVVVAHDPDADPLTLSASGLPPNATFPSVQGDSIVNSSFTFQPDFSQGPDTVIVTFSVSDDHNNVTNLPVQIIIFDQPNDRVVISSDQGGVPGALGRPVEILMYNTAPIYGAQFEILYDPFIVDVPEVLSTYRCSNMWFSSNEPEPGRIVIVIFSVGIDSIAAGQGPLAELMVDVNIDTIFGQSEIIFLSAIEVIDSIGTSKELDIENGFFTVDGFGDSNLDGVVDVGDCISIVAYIIGMNTFSQRQMEAADFNGNGFVDIGDLQDIVNFILEIIGVPQNSPEGPPVIVELLKDNLSPGGPISVPMHVGLFSEASAVQFEVSYNSDNLSCLEITLGEIASGMAIDYNITENKINCVIYNLSGGSFGPANGELVNLKFESVGLEYDLISDISVSDFIIVSPSADYIPVEIKGQLPERFALEQNYPNPFNANTNISFSLPESGQVKLQVYDLLGRNVVTLLEDFLEAGGHSISWNGRSANGADLATGVYFYRLQTEDFDKTKKMVLVK